MKKVLALVLAVLMVSTVALAAAPTVSADILPGKKIKIAKTYVDSNGADIEQEIYSGGTKSFTAVTSAPTGAFKDINSENYSVTGIKYDEGKTYIESIKINDADDELVIKMKADYSNTKAKNFNVQFTLNGKGKYTLNGSGDVSDYTALTGNTKDDNTKVSVPDLKFRVSGTVGYGTPTVVDLDSDEVDLSGIADLTKTVVKFEKDTNAYATLNDDVTDNGEVTLEVKVYDGDKFYLGVSTDANTDVLKANADSDAEMSFYEFEGEPTFNSTAKVYFNDADEESYVYQIKNGKLVKAGSYSEDDGCWVVKARTLGAYVVSDKKLSATSITEETPADQNPDTGANDVVGIATALAAVALVSAAAVSLKK